MSFVQHYEDLVHLEPGPVRPGAPPGLGAVRRRCFPADAVRRDTHLADAPGPTCFVRRNDSGTGIDAPTPFPRSSAGGPRGLAPARPRPQPCIEPETR